MTKINSEVKLVSTTLRSGRFLVPWHQRNYVWKANEEVRDLLIDLEMAFDADKTCYFLGSIMLLEPTGSMPERINDGQQRLITFSLLMAALCRCFAEHPRDTGRESRALHTLFQQPDHDILVLTDAPRYEARIKPPEGDKTIYSRLIRGDDIGSNGPLTAAWNKIKQFVSDMSGQRRADFFDFLMGKVEISVLTIPSDVDANSVFETLNGRGKSLEHVDLIRNWVLSCFSEVDDIARLKTVHTNFENASNILGAKGNKVETYFRCSLQCRYGYLQKKRFYRDFREAFQKAPRSGDLSDYAYELVGGLGRRDSIELYRIISSGNLDPSLSRYLPNIPGKRSLTVLLRELQKYKVSHPLCFALLHRFMTASNDTKREVQTEVGRSLKNLASFIMRGVFVTSRFLPSRIEEPLANCARDVFTGTDILSLNIMGELKNNDKFGIISDSEFIRRMTGIEMRNNPKALQYLYGINAHDQIGSDALTIRGCSVEHVLPQSSALWSGWTEFAGKDPAAWVYRTGNLVVISQRENQSSAGFNANFAAKCNTFSNSALLMARTVAKSPEWSPAVIEKRSKQLAKDAARIWKFHGA